MNAGALKDRAIDLLYCEALYLDSQRWDDWLALFDENCEFWVPAWRGDHELTSNPAAELSLVFYRNRAGLEERVSRVRSGKSAASTPMPRTQHAVTNIQVQVESDTAMAVRSNWTVHEHSLKNYQTLVHFGSSEHALILVGADWRIKRKKVVISNDYLPGAVDFFSI